LSALIIDMAQQVGEAMVPDHLAGTVTRDALGTGIPVSNQTICVDEVYTLVKMLHQGVKDIRTRFHIRLGLLFGSH